MRKTDNHLGTGTYGTVEKRNGLAVKKFQYTHHLLREYMALVYLDGCEYVVGSTGMDLKNKELSMDLYDCNLKTWLISNNGTVDTQMVMRIFRDILYGLVEIHDRGLAHGDLKPGNILIRNNPFKLVLGDCGFVSVAKYSKVEYTAPLYSDPRAHKHPAHDIFSLGIIMLELFGRFRLSKVVKTYQEYKVLISERINNSSQRAILTQMLDADYKKRPTARDLLKTVFKITPRLWDKTVDSTMSKSPTATGHPLAENIKNFMRIICDKYKINRSNKGYISLMSYFARSDNSEMSQEEVAAYTCATLILMSAAFGKSGFDMAAAHKERTIRPHQIIESINNLLDDRLFVDFIMSPESSL